VAGLTEFRQVARIVVAPRKRQIIFVMACIILTGTAAHIFNIYNNLDL
jgi:hypothetical protein